MVGLNVTHQVLVGPPDIERLRAAGGPVARFVAELMEFYCRTHQATAMARTHEGPLHDPLTVLAVTHPGLFETIERHVSIGLGDDATRGMTIVDNRRPERSAPPNCRVAVAVDADVARRTVLACAEAR